MHTIRGACLSIGARMRSKPNSKQEGKLTVGTKEYGAQANKVRDTSGFSDAVANGASSYDCSFSMFSNGLQQFVCYYST